MNEAVYITDKAERKLSAYLRLAEAEISGFGLAAMDTEGFLVINDIFILQQESGMAHTVLDGESMHELAYAISQRGGNVEDICLWWHSHGKGGTFFSTTDTDTIERFAELGRPWMLSLVSNQRLEHNLRLDFYHPIYATVEKVELKKFTQIDPNLDKRIQAEITRKVRKPPPPPAPQPVTRFYQNGWGNWPHDKELESYLRNVPGITLLD